MVVISTKKLSKQQILLFDAKKIKVVHANFIKTKTIPFTIEICNELTIFTSKNAVKSVLKNSEIRNIKNKKCFCVGQKTKNFLEKNGFKCIAFEENAEILASLICREYSDKKFTFFCGNIRKDTLPKILLQNKVSYNEIVVYETILTPKKIKESMESILFFSPSGINSYLEKNNIKDQTCLCIGKTTAKALENITKKIVIAPQQTIESVIETAISQILKD